MADQKQDKGADSPMDEALPPIYSIPEDIWILHIFPLLRGLELGRLAQTGTLYRHYIGIYRNTLGFGHRLALSGLIAVRDRLVEQHRDCVDDALALATRVEAYLPQLCVLPLAPLPDLPATADADPVTGDEKRELQLELAVAGRTPAKIMETWGVDETSRFLLFLSSHFVDTWDESSHAMVWGLEKTRRKTLASVFTSAAPEDTLVEAAKTPDQTALAYLVKAVCSLRTGRAYNDAKKSGLIALTKTVMNQIDAYTSRCCQADAANLEFALAVGGVVLAHSLKTAPVRRSVYLECIRASFDPKRLAGYSGPTQAMIEKLGLSGPAAKLHPLKEFDCGGSRNAPPMFGLAMMAAILGGGRQIVIPLGPDGPPGPPPGAMLDLLGALLAAGPPSDDDDDDDE